jgi:hypothetical protein
MFIAVWMLYAADRLLDARALTTSHELATELEARHFFHHHHRRAFLTGIVIASVVLAFLLHELDPAALHLYAVLATLLAVYLLLIHASPSTHRLPKELAVAIFFPAAVFIPTVARNPALRLALLPCAFLFAAVCALNCLFLYSWEHPGERPLAHWTTRWGTHHLNALTTLALVLSIALAAISIPSPATAGQPLLALACAASVALLLLLHTQRHRLSELTLRTASDLVLLTPLAFIPLLHASAR